MLGTGFAISVLLGALLWLLAQVGALYREVGRLARTDALTRMANRRAWDDELPRELARAARSGEPLCVALLDLDHFKAYNDQHGHQAGDRLLKAAAAAWQGRLRKSDPLARYGGEEFALLLPDCGLASGMEIAERLAHRPARGHLLARRGRLGRPGGAPPGWSPGPPGAVRGQGGRPRPVPRRPGAGRRRHQHGAIKILLKP